MIPIWIVPLLLTMFVIYVISANKPAVVLQPVVNHACPRCNQFVQSGWENCPFCGYYL